MYPHFILYIMHIQCIVRFNAYYIHYHSTIGSCREKKGSWCILFGLFIRIKTLNNKSNSNVAHIIIEATSHSEKRAMFGVSLRDRIRNEVLGLVHPLSKLKWQRASYISRRIQCTLSITTFDETVYVRHVTELIQTPTAQARWIAFSSCEPFRLAGAECELKQYLLKPLTTNQIRHDLHLTLLLVLMFFLSLHCLYSLYKIYYQLSQVTLSTSRVSIMFRKRAFGLRVMLTILFKVRQ